MYIVMSILSSALVGIKPNSGRLLVASLSPLYPLFIATLSPFTDIISFLNQSLIYRFVYIHYIRKHYSDKIFPKTRFGLPGYGFSISLITIGRLSKWLCFKKGCFLLIHI